MQAVRDLTCNHETTLDDAWRKVLALLPKGYAVMVRGSDDWAGRGATWKADAYHHDGRRKAWQVEAESATAALLALAERLVQK